MTNTFDKADSDLNKITGGMYKLRQVGSEKTNKSLMQTQLWLKYLKKRGKVETTGESLAATGHNEKKKHRQRDRAKETQTGRCDGTNVFSCDAHRQLSAGSDKTH